MAFVKGLERPGDVNEGGSVGRSVLDAVSLYLQVSRIIAVCSVGDAVNETLLYFLL